MQILAFVLSASLAAANLVAATSPGWLDASTPSNWNVPGAPIPAAPAPRDSELAQGGRCASTVRPPSMPEDRAVDGKGWFLIGPYEQFGGTSVLLATSSADGMCRPSGFQAFVFVNGAFAGTLAPRPMESRADASLEGSGVGLYSAQTITATFARYSESDPLCCPHGTTTVDYKIVTKNGHALLVPDSAMTSKN